MAHLVQVSTRHLSIPTILNNKMSAKSLFLYCLCLALFSCHVLSEKVIENNEKYPLSGSFPDSSSSCGDTIRSPSGTISYKSFEPVSPNERCVWTIRAPNATTYGISLTNLGISGSVVLTGIGRRGLSLTTSAPTTATSVTLRNSTVVVITFYTGPANNTNNGRGFTLTYSSTSSGDPSWASFTSEDVIVPANSGHIKYPSGRTIYDNYEVSPFLFSPILRDDGQFKRNEVIYIRDQLEGTGCSDLITVYTFDITISGADKWRSLGQICGGVEAEKISGQDIILILFQSDQSQTFSGFHLYAQVRE